MSTATPTTKPQAISFPIAEAEIASLFRELDEDHNRRLDQREFRHLFTHVRIPPPSRHVVAELFNTVDKDGDGISIDELTGFVVQRQRELKDIFDFICESYEAARIPSSSSSSTTTATPSAMDQAAIATAEAGGIPRNAFDARTFSAAARLAGVEVTQNDVEKAISKFDYNHDKVVDFSEFCEALLLVPAWNVRSVFERFSQSCWAESDAAPFFGFRIPEHHGGPPRRSAVAAQIGEIVGDDDDGNSTASAPLVDLDDEREFLNWLDRRAAAIPHPERIAQDEARVAQAAQLERQRVARAVWKKLCCGGVAGIVARTATAPLDLIRIRLMCDNSITVREVLQSATNRGGVLSLWQGNAANSAKAFPELGIKLTVFDMMLSQFNKDPAAIGAQERLVAGGVAGALSQIVVYPFDVARTRMIACTKNQFTGVVQCARHIIAHEGGLPRLFAGIGPSLIGIVPYAAIDLSVNHAMKEAFIHHYEQVHNGGDEQQQQQQQQQSPPVHDSQLVPVWALASCGLISSAVAMTVTFPINVVRTIAQSTGECSAAVSRTLWRNHGLSSFFRGFGITAVKVLPSTSLSYLVYDRLGSAWDSKMSS